MTKQEKIREEIWQILRNSGLHITEADDTLETIWTTLHSQGVVIKVERELPNNWWFKNCCRQRKKPAKICLECPFIDYKTGEVKSEPKIIFVQAKKENTHALVELLSSLKQSEFIFAVLPSDTKLLTKQDVKELLQQLS